MPTDPTADPAHRLGAALDFIRQLADPDSALSIGMAVDGVDYVRARAAEFLQRHGLTPTVYPDATRVPLRRVIAAQVPWPALAVHGLWPGDVVVHDDHGPGVVEGFNHTEWPDVLELVAGGQVLVDFDRSGGVWVRASELTRTSEADPVF
jgi:hypothetical protein